MIVKRLCTRWALTALAIQSMRKHGVKRQGTSAPDEQERTDHIRACLVTLDPKGAAALAIPDLSQRALVKEVFGGQYNGQLSNQLKEAHSCRKQMDAHEWVQVWGWLHTAISHPPTGVSFFDSMFAAVCSCTYCVE